MTEADPLGALADRCEALLHPQTGLCRGMILNTDKPHDRPEDVFPTTVGELLAVADVIRDCAAALRGAA